AYDAGLAYVAAYTAHLLEEIFGLDRREHRFHHGACHGAAAECRAERIQLDRRRQPLRGEQGSAGKPVAECLGGGDHVRSDAIHVGRKWISHATDTALHLIEDQQRTDFITTAAEGGDILLAQINRTGKSLHGLDNDRGGFIAYSIFDCADIAARYEANI